jgi:opacity protein-like surface antigen
MSDKVDLVASLSYQYLEFDIPLVGSIDDSGLGLSVGFRFAQSDKLELNAGINYVDYGDGGDDTGFALGALYDVNDAFSVGLGGEWSDTISMYTLSGRFYFGR